MGDTLKHPSTERLHAFVEKSIEGAEGAVVESHLATCTRCAAEVTELRSLFAALSALPELAPSTAFAERVMERVRIRRPAHQQALDWLNHWIDRLAPSTTRGWAVAAALVALPAVTSTALVWWVLSHPGVSAQGLWLVGSGLAADTLATGWQWAWSQVAASALAASLLGLLDAAAALGRGGVGLLAVMFATLTAGSVYVLYQNLFRTNQRRTRHASYVF